MDKNKLKERLLSYLELPYNWNDNKAEPFSKNLINKAVKFLEFLPTESQQIEVFPTARDSIQFEWCDGERYCEIELFENDLKILTQEE